VAGVIVGATSLQTVPDVIQAKKIEVVDDKGNVRVRINGSQGELIIYDREEKPQIVAVVGNDSMIYVNDNDSVKFDSVLGNYDEFKEFRWKPGITIASDNGGLIRGSDGTKGMNMFALAITKRDGVGLMLRSACKDSPESTNFSNPSMIWLSTIGGDEGCTPSAGIAIQDSRYPQLDYIKKTSDPDNLLLEKMGM
jgi:hypothetical protein